MTSTNFKEFYDIVKRFHFPDSGLKKEVITQLKTKYIGEFRIRSQSMRNLLPVHAVHNGSVSTLRCRQPSFTKKKPTIIFRNSAIVKILQKTHIQ